MKALAVAPLFALALAGCRFDPEPPATSDGPPPTITCTADTQCPPGWLCPRSLGRCVPIGERDEVAPGLVGTPTLTPGLGTIGRVFTLTFSVSEALGEDPVVALDLGGGRTARWTLDGALTDRAALAYGFRYMATGNEVEGSRLVTVDLVDAAGNAVSNLSAGSLLLDFTRPRVVATTLAPRLAAAGTPVTLELQVSEALPSAPLVELVHGDGSARPLPLAGTVGALGYRYEYTPTGQEPEGAASLRATGGDEAGNLLEAQLEPTLRLDFSPPRLLRSLVAPPVGRAGQRVLVEVDLEEELGPGGSLVAVDLTGSPLGTHAWPEASRASSRLRFEHTVAVDTDGRFRLELRDLADLAGNRAAALVVGEVAYDTRAPMVASVATDAPRYSAQTGHDVVTVTFDVDDPLTGGTLDVRLGGKGMTCGAWQPMAPSVTCTATVDGSEPEGVAAVSVRAIDAAGNEGVGSTLTRLDFTPPRLVPGTVELTLQPRAGCPAPAVTRLGVGGAARVSFVLDEAVGATPVVTSSAPEVLPFQLLGGAATSFSFGHSLGSGALAQGAYALQAAVVDEVGNAATLSLSPPTPLVVDTAAPTLQVDQAAVRYVRSPWGNAAAEDLSGFTLRAGPVFELAPAEPLTGQATFPGSTFAVDDGALLRLEVWADAQRGSLMGGTAANPDGRWPRLQLANLDTPAAWVSGYDEACNESPTVRLERAEWVATPRPPTFGAAVHSAWATPRLEPSLTQPPLIATSIGGGALAAPDQQAQSALGAPGWERLPVPPSIGPLGSGWYPAMAFDSRRGRTVLFGGTTKRETWEWDGHQWIEQFPAGVIPPARNYPHLAFDSARGQVVLFSGERLLTDTWVWDGVAWKDVTPASGNPPGRSMASMAYDSVRQRVVLFGGSSTGYLSDTWEWDGKTWTRRAVGAPGARVRSSMAFDSTRGRVVLFGGMSLSGVLADTWEWDGTVWRSMTPASGSPPGRSGHALAFDPVGRRTVLFGGQGSSRELMWAWDGTTWSDVTPTAGTTPLPAVAIVAFDAARGRLVSWESTYPTSSTQEWDGQRWHDVTPSPVAPGNRTSHAMAWDSQRKRLVLFGGRGAGSLPAETWEFAAGQWRVVVPLTTAPAARADHAMAYDPVRGRVVLFGGANPSSILGDTWEWDGLDWRNVTPASNNPAARYDHAMAWDPLRERVILFGGYPGYQDTWEWDGVSWQRLQPATSPAGRTSAEMTTDLRRQRIVLFGGYTQSPFAEKQDTWEWNGKTWTEVTPPSNNPPPRMRHAMAFDPVKQRVVLFGGGNGGTFRDDTWEWDGASWQQVLSQPARVRPTGRYDHALSWDGERVLLFGGYENESQGLIWRYESSPTKPPAIAFAANSELAGIASSQIDGLRVRAHCGASVGNSSGTQLQGWLTGGLGRLPGGWGVLATNATGSGTAAPWLPAPPAASLEWTASSPSEARALLHEGDSTFNVLCTPLATPGLELGRVAMDYVEVRVRYRTQ